MKTMKKYAPLAAAVLAVALLTAAIITGCTSPVDGMSNYATGGSGGGSTFELPEGFVLPEGMGAIQVNFGEKVSARMTVMPTDPTVSTFEEFILVFTPTSPAGPPETKTFSKTELAGNTPPYSTGVITLPYNTYTLVATAYMDSPGTLPAARSTSQTVTVDASSTATDLTVTLRPMVTGSTTASDLGTFNWDITNEISPTVSAASIAFVGIPGLTTATTTNVTLTANVTGTTPPHWISSAVSPKTIPSGYYFLNLSITANSVTKQFQHVLHVYQNMTSTLTDTYTDAHFGFTSGNTGGNIGYTHNGDYPPDFTLAGNNSVSGNAPGNAIEISLAANDVLMITVDNAATVTDGTNTGYSDIYWYANATTNVTPTVNNAELEIDLSSGTVPGPWDTLLNPIEISVTGILGDTVSNTLIYVNILP